MVDAMPAEGLGMGRESLHRMGLVWPSQPGPYRSVLALVFFYMVLFSFYMVLFFSAWFCFLLWLVILEHLCRVLKSNRVGWRRQTCKQKDSTT